MSILNKIRLVSFMPTYPLAVRATVAALLRPQEYVVLS